MHQTKPILLVNAPFFDLYGRLKAGAAHYFPLGLGYIAAVLREHGFTVELLVEDGRIDLKKELAARLESGEYLLVGFSAMTSAFPGALDLARLVKQLRPETPTLIGGPHASGIGPAVIAENPELDLACLGEGESTALEVAQALAREQKDLGAIQGLVWQDAGREVLANPARPFIRDLDTLPHPARDLVDFRAFSVGGHVTSGGGISATMITSRGCPFGCVFCSAHLQMGSRYRHHSEDYVIRELRRLKDEYGVDYVFFQDDTLTVAKKRLRSLCQRLVREDLGIAFGCFSRVDVFDAETARLLKEAGCSLVIFGVESGVPEVLDRISKKISLDQAREAIRLCRAQGIISYASFVVGFPFETEELIRRTISFGRSLDADRVTFNPLVPFPGSALYVEQLHKPADPSGWSRFLTTGPPPFDSTPGVPAARLKRMVDRAHLGYYLHPRRLLRTLKGVTSPAELGSLIRLAWGLAGGFLKGPGSGKER